MATTDVFALRSPDGADPADVPTDMAELASDAEGAILKTLGWRTIFWRPFYVVESMVDQVAYAMDSGGVMRKSQIQIAVTTPSGVIPHIHLSRAILLGSLTGLNPVVRLKAHATAGGTDPNNGTDIVCVPLKWEEGGAIGSNFRQALTAGSFGTADTFEAGVTVPDLAANGQQEGFVSSEQTLTASETFDERVALGVSTAATASPVDANSIVYGTIELQVKYVDAD